MNAKETSIIARAMATNNITTIRALLETLIVAKPVKLKVTTFAKLHATTACYCRQCYPIRWQEARDAEQHMIEAGELPMQWQTIPQADWRKAGVKLKSTMETLAGLDTCACGHLSTDHTEDALDNLIDCTAESCQCDHFHYASEPIENEAA